MQRTLKCFIVFIMLAAVPALASQPVKVLHISALGLHELEFLVASVGVEQDLAITMVTLAEGLPRDWATYDVLVFGLNDCYEDKAKQALPSPDALARYVQAGGGIVWTHDTLEYSKSWGDGLEIPAGVREVKAERIGMHNGKIRIAKEHPILFCYFDIGRYGDVLWTSPFKGFPHSGGGAITTASIIIDHQAQAADNNFYLTVNEYGRGRVVVNEIGHSVVAYNGELNTKMQPTECKILVNSIIWAARGESELGPAVDFDVVLMRSDELLDLPKPATGQKWISLNPDIATITKSGILTTHKNGFATLKLVDDYGYSSSVSLFVNEKQRTNLNALGREVTIYPNE